MEKFNPCSLKLVHVCTEIEGVISTLKQIQSHLDLRTYAKFQETITKLEEHKQYIWQIYKDLEVSE
jgi:hypothetical protein